LYVPSTRDKSDVDIDPLVFILLYPAHFFFIAPIGTAGMEVGATAAAAPLVSSSVVDFPFSVDASWGGSLEEGTVEEVAGGGQGVTEGGRGGGGGGDQGRKGRWGRG